MRVIIAFVQVMALTREPSKYGEQGYILKTVEVWQSRLSGIFLSWRTEVCVCWYRSTQQSARSRMIPSCSYQSPSTARRPANFSS
jgi:hypothetical protein